MTRLVWLALFPVPDVENRDTSLRYTDILFGFVIRELFLRLQKWPTLSPIVQWHLVAGTTLVLGSWIGYRRSLNRTTYQVKFFNLPLLKFVVDQLMLILYFRIAVLTNVGEVAKDQSQLAEDTTWLIVWVFVLYVLWDLLGVWMALAKEPSRDGTRKPRYPLVKNNVMTEEQEPVRWTGRLITVIGLLFLTCLWIAQRTFNPQHVLIGVVLVLVAYRWAKDLRSSWNLPQRT